MSDILAGYGRIGVDDQLVTLTVPPPASLSQRRSDLVSGTSLATLTQRLVATASPENGVLEYSPTEILPQLGAMLAGPAALCRPRRERSPETCAESRGSCP